MRKSQCEGVKMNFKGSFTTTKYDELTQPRWTDECRMRGLAVFRISAKSPRA